MGPAPLHVHGEGPDLHLAGGLLTIDLGALTDNYRLMAQRSGPARAAAVVKADAYGIGIAHAVPALAAAGCDTFFVALPQEGVTAREAAPDARIFVLSGPLSAESAPVYRAHRLTPVLNSLHDIAAWEAGGWDGDSQLGAALHVDTGMNRLGLTPAEAERFAADNALTGAVKLMLIMSHLACADEPEHELNRKQLESFQQLVPLFPDIDSSLANSAGILLGRDYVAQLTRPGIALYGGNPTNDNANAMKPVVTAQARVLQVREARAGETVGYGAAQRLSRDSRIAMCACGYADGFHRAGSGAGVPLRDAAPPGGNGFIGGRRVPVLGRVSMDLTAFDVTDVDDVNPGDMMELFGPNILVEEAAEAAGTIAYEMLTALGRRYHRIYVGAG